MGAQPKQQWTTQEKKDQNVKNERNPSDTSQPQKNPAQSSQGGLKKETTTPTAEETTNPVQYPEGQGNGNERLGGMKGEASVRND